ncbi:MAG: cbb3-type cytochrome c oxidase N-terminal domain-containing protein [Chitinophagaceae bacterium]
MNYKKQIFRILGALLPALMLSGLAKAQDAAAPGAIAPEKLSIWTSGAGILMVATIIILMAVIYIMGKIVKTLIEEDTLQIARDRKAKKGLLTVLVLLGSTLMANAQDAAAAAVDTVPMVLDMEATVFWILLGVLVFEFVVILVLCFILYTFLVRKGLIQPFQSVMPKWLQWNTMMGSDKPIEKEAEQLIDHDYDGIQELDNGMPPMLKYIFIGTILFAVYYWTDYHVIKASPLSIAEYEAQIEQGEQDRLEYIKKAGASVDENSVTLLADASMIGGGEKIYVQNCVACHGDKGQGGVGPNLTDPYWIHGGDIHSIFKTIKYGVPEKGMRSWQSEIKPADMQAVVSYIITAFGNKNVAGGKAPQGDLYSAAAPAAGADSSKTSAPADSNSAAPAKP